MIESVESGGASAVLVENWRSKLIQVFPEGDGG